MTRRRPVAEPRTHRSAPAPGIARVTLWFYAVGTALVLLLAAETAASGGPGVPVLTAVSAAGVVASSVLRWWGDRLGMSTLHALLVLSVLLVGTASWAAPSAASAVAVTGMCAFTTFAAVYTCSRVAAAEHCALAVLVCLAVLSPREGAGPVVAVLVAGISCAIGYVLGPVVTRAAGASVDHLTGLLNRRGHEEALEAALASAPRDGSPLTLALVDVDHFKAVNDTRGHDAGDALLRSFAAACAAHLPAGASRARVGGDEFAVVLRTKQHQSADQLQELLGTPAGDPQGGPRGGTRGGTGGSTGGSTGGGTWGERLSVGVAQWRPGESAAELTRRADGALYQAKAAGRGRVVMAGASDDLATDLAAALASGGIAVVLQPVVAVATARVVGFEALARWDRPGHGPVSPVEFVAAAEEHGLIEELGRQVLARAAADVVRLRRVWGRPLFCTVNASGLELVRPGYAAGVLAAAAAAGLRPSHLVVEVTESTLEAGDTGATAAIRELRAAGVRVAIDDFGTGYSTMARLDQLPADLLKLDTSFTRGLVGSPRRRAMLAALQQMATALGMQVVVEGVETDEDREHVAAAGCALAQGWSYGRPAPVEALLAQEATASLAGAPVTG